MKYKDHCNNIFPKGFCLNGSFLEQRSIGNVLPIVHLESFLFKHLNYMCITIRVMCSWSWYRISFISISNSHPICDIFILDHFSINISI